jgi:hypothetical protein
MNNELGRMWNEVVEVYSQVLSRNMSLRVGNITENLRRNGADAEDKI